MHLKINVKLYKTQTPKNSEKLQKPLSIILIINNYNSLKLIKIDKYISNIK